MNRHLEANLKHQNSSKKQCPKEDAFTIDYECPPYSSATRRKDVRTIVQVLKTGSTPRR